MCFSYEIIRCHMFYIDLYCSIMNSDVVYLPFWWLTASIAAFVNSGWATIPSGLFILQWRSWAIITSGSVLQAIKTHMFETAGNKNTIKHTNIRVVHILDSRISSSMVWTVNIVGKTIRITSDVALSKIWSGFNCQIVRPISRLFSPIKKLFSFPFTATQNPILLCKLIPTNWLSFSLTHNCPKANDQKTVAWRHFSLS